MKTLKEILAAPQEISDALILKKEDFKFKDAVKIRLDILDDIKKITVKMGKIRKVVKGAPFIKELEPTLSKVDKDIAQLVKSVRQI